MMEDARKFKEVQSSKHCPDCNRILPIEEFFLFARGYTRRCKTCHLAKRKEWRYAKNKQKHGITRNDKDQWVDFHGRSPNIYWTGNMISILKRHYATTKNKELAELLNVSESTLTRKARELNLQKDTHWRSQTSRDNIFCAQTYIKNRKKKKSDIKDKSL